MKAFVLLLIIEFISCSSMAQETKPAYNFNVGIGLGLDHGGIGVRLSLIKFTQQFELITGTGYNFVGFGWNAGLLLRSSPQKSVAAYIIGLYGNNAVIIQENSNPYTGSGQQSKAYYGPSFGTGLEFRGRKRKNFFKLGLFVPIRSEKFSKLWIGKTVARLD
jgi:hypothetical protein